MATFERAGLTFDFEDSGPPDGPAVLLLHGFPQGPEAWREIAPHLHAAGLRTLVPAQRGYSPGARPEGRSSYVQREVALDALACLDAAGVQRAHVVGHDWGGTVAWALGAHWPQRVRTLTALSTPHPGVLSKVALRSTQLLSSWYMFAFQVPGLAERLLAPGSPGWRALTTGLPEDVVAEYGARLGEPGALSAVLGWYRALPLDLASPSVRFSRVEVPTLYIWGSRDPALGRAAAEATASMVTGPYRFLELTRAGHWLPEGHPQEITAALLAHIR